MTTSLKHEPAWTRDNYLAVSYTSDDGPSYGSTTREVFMASSPFVGAKRQAGHATASSGLRAGALPGGRLAGSRRGRPSA